MTDDKTSFWTPARIAVAIGAVLLVVALAVLVSLPQNKYHPCDLGHMGHFSTGVFVLLSHGILLILCAPPAPGQEGHQLS